MRVLIAMTLGQAEAVTEAIDRWDDALRSGASEPTHEEKMRHGAMMHVRESLRHGRDLLRQAAIAAERGVYVVPQGKDVLP